MTIDRASVSMGDDVEHHLEFWEFPDTTIVDDLLIVISTRFLPRVAGPAGWCVYQDIDDLTRKRLLGIIYTRDDLGQEPVVCRHQRGSDTLTRLAGGPAMSVYVGYLTGDAARPVTLAEMRPTGAQPAVLTTQARVDALVDSRAARENARLAAAVTDARRSWISANLLRVPEPPVGTDHFIANNFHFLADLYCRASMRITEELLGDHHPTSPSTRTLSMVAGAFEWGISRESVWRSPTREHCARYFAYLAACGYPMSPIEHLMSGDAGAEQLDPRQARIRELRNAEYNLTRNHQHQLINQAQYLAMLAPIEAALIQLGETPHRAG